MEPDSPAVRGGRESRGPQAVEHPFQPLGVGGWQPFGGDTIMHGQLRRILDLGERPTVQVRILPFRPTPTPNRNEAFTTQTAFYLLKLPERGTILYLEDFAGSTYPEDVKVIQQYAMAFERLLSAAADPAASRDLIAKVARQCQ